MMLDGMTGRYRWPVLVALVVLVVALASGVALAGNGPGKGGTGGQGAPPDAPEAAPIDTGGTEGGAPDDAGPTSHESEEGTLYGDLYKLLRYHGDESYVDESNVTHTAIGGEPILSDGFGWYAEEMPDGSYEPRTTATLDPVAFPDGVYSRVVQPVASYERWGDIWTTWHSLNTGYTPPTDYELYLDKNRIPLVITYDPTWNRFEAEVGLLLDPPTVNSDGTLAFNVEEHFIHATDNWTDPYYGGTIEEDIPWTDLLQPVEFGRISVSRSPDAVLESAFDEAINTINSDDTVAIEVDASGRLLLTKNVYDEYGEPVLDADGIQLTTKKAIDSPLENLALYTKLLNDGHLVTPADERDPIDRSLSGGIPISKLLELEDGPDTALRPTIDIEKMRYWGLGSLVDVQETTYWAYYDPVTDKVESFGSPDDPAIPAGQAVDEAIGITTMEGMPYGVSGDDFGFAAAFLAAAADKTSHIGVDFVVYLNSILGINQVIGDLPAGPVYKDFGGLSGYNRGATMGGRGEVAAIGGGGNPSTYTGQVNVLQQPDALLEPEVWAETLVGLTTLGFDDLAEDPETHFRNGNTATSDILGFTQMADDDLSVIEFIHTYQIPERR